MLSPPVRLRTPPCPSATVAAAAQPAVAACAAVKSAPPRIAIGLAGLTRTLANPLVYKSIRGNLVDALGAPSTLFALLRSNDERVVNMGKTSKGGSALVTVAAEERVLAALAYIGVARDNIVLENITAYPLPQCDWYTHPVKPPDKPCNNYLNICSIQAMIGMTRSRRRMYEMFVRHEERAGLRFDSVLFMRPDLAVIVPVPPWCMQPLETSRNKNDHIAWVPRRDLEASLREGMDDFLQCRVVYGSSSSEPSGYNESLVDDVVSYGKRTVGIHGGHSRTNMNYHVGTPENWLKFAAARHGAQMYQDESLEAMAIVREPAFSMPWVGHVCGGLARALYATSAPGSTFHVHQRPPYDRSACPKLLYSNPSNRPEYE